MTDDAAHQCPERISAVLHVVEFVDRHQTLVVPPSVDADAFLAPSSIATPT